MALSNQILLKLNAEKNCVRCFQTKRARFCFSSQDLKLSLRVSVDVSLCFTPCILTHFVRPIDFIKNNFSQTIGQAGTLHLLLYSLPRGEFRIICSINMKVRRPWRFKSCSSSYSRPVSGQLQSLSLLDQEYQAHRLGGKRGKTKQNKTKSKTKAVFSRRD